jgi:hypothetical protein
MPSMSMPAPIWSALLMRWWPSGILITRGTSEIVMSSRPSRRGMKVPARSLGISISTRQPGWPLFSNSLSSAPYSVRSLITSRLLRTGGVRAPKAVDSTVGLFQSWTISALLLQSVQLPLTQTIWHPHTPRKMAFALLNLRFSRSSSSSLAASSVVVLEPTR